MCSRMFCLALLYTHTLLCMGAPQLRSISDIWCYRAGEAAVVGLCDHGDMVGPCGRVCLKGPGQVCGGPRSVYGQCGESLHCSSCNRCVGCSFSSFVCFDDRDCLYQDDRLFRWNRKIEGEIEWRFLLIISTIFSLSDAFRRFMGRNLRCKEETLKWNTFLLMKSLLEKKDKYFLIR